MSDDVESLVADVLASATHRAADPGLIARIGAGELASRRSRRDAVKATKTKLHQALGAFWLKRPRYGAWLADLRAAAGSADALRAACFEIMRWHASTAERLEELDGFYAAVFADAGDVGSVADLGCGLNPLALPWMGLPPGVRYDACDADRELVDFVAEWLEMMAAGRAETCDLLAGPPRRGADVALLLKLLTSLEALDREAPARLLGQVRAPVIVVSYPLASLGRRVRYRDVQDRFAAHAGRLADAAVEHRFRNEVIYVVRR